MTNYEIEEEEILFLAEMPGVNVWVCDDGIRFEYYEFEEIKQKDKRKEIRPLQNRRKSPFVPLLKKGEIFMIIIYQWLTPSRTCKGGSGRDQFWGFAMVLLFFYLEIFSYLETWN